MGSATCVRQQQVICGPENAGVHLHLIRPLALRAVPALPGWRVCQSMQAAVMQMDKGIGICSSCLGCLNQQQDIRETPIPCRGACRAGVGMIVEAASGALLQQAAPPAASCEACQHGM